MADKTDVLLQLFLEERAQARQSEDQRATLTNIIIVVVGAGLAFISDRKLGRDALPLSVAMIVIGLYGAVASRKYFERWYRHWARSFAYRAQLLEPHPEVEAELASYSHKATRDRPDDRYEQEADNKFNLSRKVKLHHLWVGFHCAIVVGGAVLTILILGND